MTINKEKFEVMDIDDVFIVQDIEDLTQVQITCFYINEKNRDREWSFILKLN